MGDLVTTRDLAAPSDSLGRYRLLGVLGQGNRATFHLGIAGGIGTFKKLVVVKELRPDLVGESRAVEAFLAEAKLAARLNHPNVVHALEADSDGGRPFLALEFLDGQSFREIRRRSLEVGGVSLAAQVHVLCEALTGLHHAHQLCDYDGRELRMVHGDVRPENVFVTYDGQVKVMNFGAARLDERANMSNGRLAYAAPEQVRGRPSDRRTDVFAIGVMLWEVLAGKPFTADPTNSAALKARLFGLEPRISQAVPGLPHGLINICNRAISVDPADRFSTAEDFRDALLAFLRASGEAIDARKTGVQIRALFGPERAAMHRIIDSALNLEVEPAASTRSPSEREPAASARSPSERETPRQGDAPAVTSVPPLSRALEPDEIDDIEDVPKFRSRRPAMVAALGATLLAAAGGFWFGMSPVVNEQSGSAATAPPGVAGVASVVVPPPAAPAAPQPEQARAEAAAPQPEQVSAEAVAPQPEQVSAEAVAPQPEQVSAEAVAPRAEQARAEAVPPRAEQVRAETAAPRAEQTRAKAASETSEPLPAPSVSAQSPRSRLPVPGEHESQTPGRSPDNPYEE